MAIELVEVKKNTRGANTREIKFMAIGKYVTGSVSRRKKTLLDENGNPVKDAEGNEVKVALADDEVIEEEVTQFVSDGVLTDMKDAVELCNGSKQLLLDCFAEGFNERQYSIAANKDELDEFIRDMELDEDSKTTFKRMSRQLSRNYDMELIEAAEQVKGYLLKQKAKAEAKAKSEAAA